MDTRAMDDWARDHAVVTVLGLSCAAFFLFEGLAAVAHHLPSIMGRLIPKKTVGGRVTLKYCGGDTRQLILVYIEVHNRREGEGFNCMLLLNEIASEHGLQLILQCANTKEARRLGNACCEKLGFQRNEAYSTHLSEQFDGPKTRAGSVDVAYTGSTYLVEYLESRVNKWLRRCKAQPWEYATFEHVEDLEVGGFPWGFNQRELLTLALLMFLFTYKCCTQ